MTKPDQKVTLEKIVSLAKRKGFVFLSSEIYGGLNGVYDIGPLGALLKENLRKAWKKSLINTGHDIIFMEGSILGPKALWEASGHLENFSDPMVDCTKCKHRYRADELDLDKGCPHCGAKEWTDVRQFNMMFETNLGATADQAHKAYLRPETAQSIFVNFKNVLNSSRAKIPFGIAQIGKAFRNEITPKQFLFRVREFEQMEIEFFCKEKDALKFFDFWLKNRIEFYDNIGFNPENIKLREHKKEELSHYSTATSDIEYHFPFGWKELEGIAYRNNFDLSQHSKFSGKDLNYYDEETKSSYIPHVVECSVGTDRLMLAVLFDAYCEENIDDDQRIVLKFKPEIAPIRAAFLPLTKKQAEPMEKIYKNFKAKGYNIQFDTPGSIGRRYRRQDEIGTPYCFTYDFNSEEDNCVTVRDRDTMEQKRISIDQIEDYLK